MSELKQYIRDRQEDSFFFGIYVADEHIGNVKAGPIDWRHRHSDVGILIGEKMYWGKGYGTDAIKLLCEHAFSEGIHCLTAGILEGNDGAMAAFRKAGFQRARSVPEYWRFEGEWRSWSILARTNPDKDFPPLPHRTNSPASAINLLDQVH